MKKKYLMLVALMISLSISGCSNKVEDEIKINEENITVYTTVFPIYDFVRNIGKEKVNLSYIIPPGVEPHDYEITPKILKDIQNADLLIKNGLGMDTFADKIEAESELKIVVASEGIIPISYDDKDVHVHEDDEVHVEESDHEHEHGQYDPHVWLDIDFAIKECENIKNALIKVDEENKEYYENNYKNYVNKLEDLNKKYNDELEGLSKDNIIVSHDAYGYLCKKYGINQLSITGISPNQEPSLSKISEISNYAKENNIGYVLFDGLVNPRVAETIADEAKIKTEVLYSIDGVTKKDFDNNEDYISLMNKNLETLKLVLK